MQCFVMQPFDGGYSIGDLKKCSVQQLAPQVLNPIALIEIQQLAFP